MLVALSQIVIGAADLAAAFLFLFGLKRMSSPATAASGIRVAGLGMIAAVLASFLYAFTVEPAARPHLMVNLALAVTALGVGGLGAWLVGRKAAMTAMPQMVAIYNGMGGGAAGAIAAVELLGAQAHGPAELIATLLGGLIGAVSLSGSLIAWAKLDGVLKQPLRAPGQQIVNLLVFVAAVAVGAVIVAVGAGHAPWLSGHAWIAVFFALSILFGVLMTLPIGGADMPVVISIYNAFTGLAVAIEGFALQNPALMIAGMVVGAAGLLLTLLMARAMNRSVANVLFTNFGAPAKGRRGGTITGTERSVAASDAAIRMRYAASVIIVPGYGLAAARAQQKLYEFVKLLQAAKVKVRFAIHPVAGRMPGQMDVLLAEAGVPYDMIFQLDDINADFVATDVALVIGANDVVNPAARTDKASPIYGMPILDADKAAQVYVVKRGQGKGYSGIVNALFYEPCCEMVYGDAQAVLVSMIEAVRGLGAAAA